MLSVQTSDSFNLLLNKFDENQTKSLSAFFWQLVTEKPDSLQQKARKFYFLEPRHLFTLLIKSAKKYVDIFFCITCDTLGGIGLSKCTLIQCRKAFKQVFFIYVLFCGDFWPKQSPVKNPICSKLHSKIWFWEDLPVQHSFEYEVSLSCIFFTYTVQNESSVTVVFYK